MIQALSIVGDALWIMVLAVMCSLSWSSWKKIPVGTPVPVAWKDGVVTRRVHRLPALWLVPALAIALGVWLKFESRAPGLEAQGAMIALGVRVTLAPLAVLLHLSQVRRALAALDAEGQLKG
ncbi:MAG: hypothetical protein Q7U20_03460 [Caulobacter sp.]|nr:hypothetical protein [Caulobacter sp.]